MPDGRKYGPVIAKNQNFILLSYFVHLSFEPPFKVWEYVKELWAACVPGRLWLVAIHVDDHVVVACVSHVRHRRCQHWRRLAQH